MRALHQHRREQLSPYNVAVFNDAWSDVELQLRPLRIQLAVQLRLELTDVIWNYCNNVSNEPLRAQRSRL